MPFAHSWDHSCRIIYWFGLAYTVLLALQEFVKTSIFDLNNCLFRITTQRYFRDYITALIIEEWLYCTFLYNCELLNSNVKSPAHISALLTCDFESPSVISLSWMNECKDVNHSYDFTSKHFWNLKHMSNCLQSKAEKALLFNRRRRCLAASTYWEGKSWVALDAVKRGLQWDKRSMLLGKINQLISFVLYLVEFKIICIQAV